MNYIKQRREKRRRKRATPVQAVCRNCGEQMHGPYCSQCGQYLFAGIKRSVADFFTNMLENLFAFDNKIVITLKYLLFFPGRLTRDYVQGRIVRYVHPAKLFWFVILIFIALLGAHISRGKAGGNWFGPNNDEQKAEKNEQQSFADAILPDLQAAFADSLRQAILSDTALLKQVLQAKNNKQTSRKETDAQAKTPSPRKPTLEDTTLLKQTAKANNGTQPQPDDDDDNSDKWKNYIESSIAYLPYAIIALIPFFSFLLYILFYKRGRYFVDHMAFAFHFHSFLFLLICLVMAIYLLWPKANIPGVGFLFLVAPFVYFVIALSVVYKPGSFSLIVKTGIFMFAYAITVFVVAILFFILVAMLLNPDIIPEFIDDF